MKQILFSLLFSAVTLRAADRPLGQLPTGQWYIRDEISFCLKAAPARILSPAGAARKAVDRSQLLTLHPAIREVVGNHLSASNWLHGLPLPAALRHTGAEVPEIARSLTAMLTKSADAPAVVEELRRHSDVQWASLNVLESASYIPNDTFWTNQWGPSRVLATNAWDISQAVTDLRIAIVDTGVDLTHPDLRIVYQRGFAGNTTGDAQRDVRGGSSIDHGTHVAGIAAAIRDNNAGIAGIADIGIMAMGCALWNAASNIYQIGSSTDAINDAVANGAAVINCSFSQPAPLSAAMQSALDNAQNNRVIVVCAAGNDGTNILSSPSAGWAAHPWPIIVSNIQQDDTLRPGSNYGDQITIAAPGTGIFATFTTNYTMPVNGGAYNGLTGTSQASPHVAGGAAMVRSMNPNLINGPGTRDLLYRMAQDLGTSGKDSVYGYGMLQLPASSLSILKNAATFAGFNVTTADGTYEHPYTTLSVAIASTPPGGTIVLNAGVGGPPVYTYVESSISSPVRLTAFPDRTVKIRP